MQRLTNRQQRFEAAVAEAARTHKPAKPRGRPAPENMTEEGRQLGLEAARNAPRCRCKNRLGEPCKAPAMRGSTRCQKHGGRVEVPEHPYNLKRFFEGRLHPHVHKNQQHQPTYGPDGMTDEEFWDALTYPQRKELMEVCPPEVIQDEGKLLVAARCWVGLRDKGYPGLTQFRKMLAVL